MAQTYAKQQDPAALLIEVARTSFARSHEKIVHCVNQLCDDELHWRPFEGQNSISNVILHLCGNVRQWIIAGVGGAPDVRKRQLEFSDRTRYSKAQLLERLADAVAEVDRVLASTPPDQVTVPRRIQGFDETVASAIFDTAAHFTGHTHEIVYITRLRKKEAYRFQWVPQGKEQGETV